MDKSDVIKLVKTTYTMDMYGVRQPTTTEREVFCNAFSVSQTEFFQGGAQGLKPEWRFDMFFYDYEGEENVIYNGVNYVVYRTYRSNDDTIELYCQRKLGAQ